MFFEYDPFATLAGSERLAERAQALRQTLLPLRDYVRHRTARLDTSSPYAQATFQHIRELENAFRAVAEYHAAVEEMLRVHWPRQQLAQRQLLPAEREADPLYQLGYVRGYRRGQAVSRQAHEKVLSLYARHAVLAVPPGYTPSPLIVRVQHFLDTLTERYGPLPADDTAPLQQAA